MDITVDIKDFVGKMKTDLESYNSTYKKTVQMYQEKHQEYNTYLKKMIDTVYDGDDMEKLKQAPYMPHWDGKRYADMISALGAHTTEFVTMSTSEYNNTMEALHQANLDIGTSFASMVNNVYTT